MINPSRALTVRVLLVALALAVSGIAAPRDAGSRSTRAAQVEGTPTATGCSASTSTPVGEGRVEIVVEARPTGDGPVMAATLRAACDIVAERLAGTAGVTVSLRDERRIVVVVDADADLEAIGRLITRVGLMEIIDPQGEMLPIGSLVTTSLGGPVDVPLPPEVAGTPLATQVYRTIVSSGDVVDAFVTFDQLDAPVVGFELSSDGADRFYEFTSAHIGLPIAILIDKRVVSSPFINDAISDSGTISGLLTEVEVEELVVLLGTEALPVPLEVVEVGGTPVAGSA